VRHLSPSADTIHKDILFRQVVFATKPPKACAPFSRSVIKILIVLLVAIVVHLVSANVRAVALKVGPCDQGEVIFVGKFYETLETTVIGDIDFDIFGLGKLCAERLHPTHRALRLPFTLPLEISLTSMWHPHKKRDVVIARKLGRFDQRVNSRSRLAALRLLRKSSLPENGQATKQSDT
jgi:hypothetical protein